MPATQALNRNNLHAAYVGIEWRRDNLHAGFAITTRRNELLNA
jgi:hypothetical protein